MVFTAPGVQCLVFAVCPEICDRRGVEARNMRRVQSKGPSRKALLRSFDAAGVVRPSAVLALNLGLFTGGSLLALFADSLWLKLLGSALITAVTCIPTVNASALAARTRSPKGPGSALATVIAPPSVPLADSAASAGTPTNAGSR